MRGSLGEKIGEGGSADIHAWAPGQVVKLFKPARGRQRLSRHEAQMTRRTEDWNARVPEWPVEACSRVIRPPKSAARPGAVGGIATHGRRRGQLK